MYEKGMLVKIFGKPQLHVYQFQSNQKIKTSCRKSLKSLPLIHSLAPFIQ